jgi:hypothetical protein
MISPPTGATSRTPSVGRRVSPSSRRSTTMSGAMEGRHALGEARGTDVGRFPSTSNSRSSADRAAACPAQDARAGNAPQQPTIANPEPAIGHSHRAGHPVQQENARALEARPRRSMHLPREVAQPRSEHHWTASPVRNLESRRSSLRRACRVAFGPGSLACRHSHGYLRTLARRGTGWCGRTRAPVCAEFFDAVR